MSLLDGSAMAIICMVGRVPHGVSMHHALGLWCALGSSEQTAGGSNARAREAILARAQRRPSQGRQRLG